MTRRRKPKETPAEMIARLNAETEAITAKLREIGIDLPDVDLGTTLGAPLQPIPPRPGFWKEVGRQIQADLSDGRSDGDPSDGGDD